MQCDTNKVKIDQEIFEKIDCYINAGLESPNIFEDQQSEIWLWYDF